MGRNGDSGIDASVSLTDYLDGQAAGSKIAASAPRGPGLYRFLAEREARGGAEGEAYAQFTEALIRQLGIWWSPQTYERMPVLTPWCVRDRSCRYDQGPESWGAPLPSGFLRDDNSIIKKLPLPLTVEAPTGHPYARRKPWRGFTACHVWRDLPGGAVAGEDAWLYSFVPNLVWLPKWIAPLSDRQGSRTQRLLMGISLGLFRTVRPRDSVEPFCEASWAQLEPAALGPRANPGTVATFTPTAAFFARRTKTIDQFIRGCDRVLSGQALDQKIICSRYTAQLPLLDRARIRAFADALREYGAALRTASEAP